jgi:ABC-type transport system substrate-binding protein
VISGYWEAVGIQTQIVPMDFTAMRSAWIAKDPKIMGGVAPWMSIGGGSAANSIPAQQNHMTSKGVNISGNDPELDSLFFAMVAELDPNKRLEIWKTVQKRAFDLHSVLGVARVYEQYAVSDKIGEWNGRDHQAWTAPAYMMGLSGVRPR